MAMGEAYARSPPSQGDRKLQAPSDLTAGCICKCRDLVHDILSASTEHGRFEALTGSLVRSYRKLLTRVKQKTVLTVRQSRSAQALAHPDDLPYRRSVSWGDVLLSPGLGHLFVGDREGDFPVSPIASHASHQGACQVSECIVIWLDLAINGWRIVSLGSVAGFRPANNDRPSCAHLQTHARGVGC